MVQEIQVATWKEFRDKLFSFSQLDRDARNNWWFRGQDDATHELVASIDRGKAFANDRDRSKYIGDLLGEFRREYLALGKGDPVLPDDAFELLARHHGLPSPLLDWTRSPWIACFFAFNSAGSTQAVVLRFTDFTNIAFHSLSWIWIWIWSS